MRSTKHPFLFLACIAMVLAAISCQAVSDLAEEKPAAASEEPLQAAPSDTPVPAAALEAEETAAPTQAEVTATAVPASPTAEPPTPAPPTATETAAPQATEPPTAAAPAAGPGACSPEPCTSDGFFLLGRPIGAGGRNTIDPSNRFGSYQRRTREAHHGVDFLNSSGTPVLAAADGVVVVAGDDLQTSYGPHTNTYGNLVILEHNLPGFDLPLFSLYAHLSQISVQSGDAVSSGQEIGRVGMSGSVFGSTLHFEVRLGENSYGSVRNPELWLAPLPDESGQPMGALAGQVVDANGKQLPVSNILVERLGGPGQPALDQIYLKTYSDLRLAGLEPLAESFAAADLPAGPYQITFWLNNREQQRLVEIQPGKLTFVSFQIP